MQVHEVGGGLHVGARQEARAGDVEGWLRRAAAGDVAAWRVGRPQPVRRRQHVADGHHEKLAPACGSLGEGSCRNVGLNLGFKGNIARFGQHVADGHHKELRQSARSAALLTYQ